MLFIVHVQNLTIKADILKNTFIFAIISLKVLMTSQATGGGRHHYENLNKIYKDLKSLLIHNFRKNMKIIK